MKKLSALIALILISTVLSALPDSFSTVSLGMSVDETKEALKKDSSFGYRGDRDVSLAPVTKETLIETDSRYAGYSFLERCWFQFENGKLYIMTINLDQSKLDHYSVFSALCKKYGNPDEISPQKSVWKDNDVIMSLERPLTLKYMDAKVFEEKMNKSNVEKSFTEKTAEEFLGGL